MTRCLRHDSLLILVVRGELSVVSRECSIVVKNMGRLLGLSLRYRHFSPKRIKVGVSSIYDWLHGLVLSVVYLFCALCLSLLKVLQCLKLTFMRDRQMSDG